MPNDESLWLGHENDNVGGCFSKCFQAPPEMERALDRVADPSAICTGFASVCELWIAGCDTQKKPKRYLSSDVDSRR